MHLSETGLHAGRRFCGNSNREEKSIHATYAPLEILAFREKACPECLKIWALEAYEDGDDMPAYIQEIRTAIANDSLNSGENHVQ